MDFTEGRTPYDILELTSGPQASEADVRKAYKTMALKKHPDKNKANPNAAMEFNEIEKAYRVLIDASARGALDEYLSAKQQRVQRQSQETDKRRKMREDLERREKEVTAERSEEHVARSRLQKELDRLRKQAEEEQRAAAQAQAQAAAAGAAAAAAGHTGSAGPDGGHSEETKAQLRCSLKVSWDPTTRDYTPQELRTIFSFHGTVADVVVRERKARGSTGRAGHAKATALVVMGSWQEADRAAAAVNGDVGDPLLVMPLLKVAPSLAEGAGPNLQASAAPASRTQGQGQPAFPVPPPSGNTNGTQGGTGGLFPAGASASGQPLFSAAGVGSNATGKPLFAAGANGPPLFAAGGAAGGKPLFAAGAGLQGAGTANTFPVSSGPATSGFGSFPGSGGFATGMGGMGGGAAGGSAEDAILLKMRRAAERERQLAAAKAEDG